MVSAQPLRLAIAGMTHDHVHGVLQAGFGDDVSIVGIWEPNQELANRLAERYKLSKELIYSDLEQMLDECDPEAVAGFGSIYDHLELVEQAAPRGVHVMVEKPLAVNYSHAKKIASLAQKNDIIVMTNYETTWYPSHYKLEQIVESGKIGSMNKVIVYDGHSGPIGIGISKEFEEWLTDPVLNGGGAVIDFGCYGANLMTWLTKGELPSRVYADVRTHDSATYPKVDDDATILLSYDDVEAVVNGSWAWSFGRKDMHLYASKGYVFADNQTDLRMRIGEREPEKDIKATAADIEYDNPFSYLRAWVRGDFTPAPYALSSLENNITVVKILDAAKRSAKTGRAVKIK